MSMQARLYAMCSMNCQGNRVSKKEETSIDKESIMAIDAIAKCCKECNSSQYTQIPFT